MHNHYWTISVYDLYLALTFIVFAFDGDVTDDQVRLEVKSVNNLPCNYEFRKARARR